MDGDGQVSVFFGFLGVSDRRTQNLYRFLRLLRGAPVLDAEMIRPRHVLFMYKGLKAK